MYEKKDGPNKGKVVIKRGPFEDKYEFLGRVTGEETLLKHRFGLVKTNTCEEKVDTRISYTDIDLPTNRQ